MSNVATFFINLSSDQVLEYYRGNKTMVRVQADSGQNLSLPYDILLRFVTQEGIKGHFKITYLNNGKLGSLIRLN